MFNESFSLPLKNQFNKRSFVTFTVVFVSFGQICVNFTQSNKEVGFFFIDKANQNSFGPIYTIAEVAY